MLPESDDDQEKSAPLAIDRDETLSEMASGPGRTGVKGVIRDYDEANALLKLRKVQDIAEMSRRMEKASLGGKTFLEEEYEWKLEQAMREGISDKYKGNETGRRHESSSYRKQSRFGHLREVGMKGFVPSVEHEKPDVWVVVHIYEPVRAPIIVRTRRLMHPIYSLSSDVHFSMTS